MELKGTVFFFNKMSGIERLVSRGTETDENYP
jgi:hypothetical protein